MRQSLNLEVNGKLYRATVLQVQERDPDGSPRTFRLLREDESVDVTSGKEAFWVVFAPPEMSQRLS